MKTPLFLLAAVAHHKQIATTRPTCHAAHVSPRECLETAGSARCFHCLLGRALGDAPFCALSEQRAPRRVSLFKLKPHGRTQFQSGPQAGFLAQAVPFCRLACSMKKVEHSRRALDATRETVGRPSWLVRLRSVHYVAPAVFSCSWLAMLHKVAGRFVHLACLPNQFPQTKLGTRHNTCSGRFRAARLDLYTCFFIVHSYMPCVCWSVCVFQCADRSAVFLTLGSYFIAGVNTGSVTIHDVSFMFPSQARRLSTPASSR